MPIFLKIIFSIFMIIGVVSPETTWQMSEGWKFKDAEPSEAYLVMTRIMSLAALVIVWFIVPGTGF